MPYLFLTLDFIRLSCFEELRTATSHRFPLDQTLWNLTIYQLWKYHKTKWFLHSLYLFFRTTAL